MITVDDQLLVTNEMNAIVIDYTHKIVLKKLLTKFSFESRDHAQVITDLIQSVNYYGVDTKPPEIELELSKYLWSFFTTLKKEERAALYFWVLNQKYLCYLDEFECNNEEFSKNEYDSKFGRELAYKIYKPNDSGLIQDTIHELKNYLINFASELDLSVIDEYTSEQIQEEIASYCL